MFKKHLVSTICGLLLMGLMFTNFTGNDASAQFSTEGLDELNINASNSKLSSLNQVNGGPGHIVLNAFDFVPNNWSLPPAFDGTKLYNPSPSSWATFKAPVHLPDGAVINKMVVFYLDNADPYLDLWVWLQECPLAMTECVTVLSGVSAHGDPNFRIMELVPEGTPTVNLQSNSYLVIIDVPKGGLVGITGIRIDYGYPSMLPLIQK